MSGAEGITARIIRLYEAGMPLAAVARHAGYNPKTVRRILRDAGIAMRGPGPVPLPVSAEQAAAVVAACDVGSQQAAAESCGLPLRAVRRVLAERDASLTALRWAWEGLYQITASPGGLEAWRIDGTGSVSAGTVEGLRDAIREDWPKYADGIRNKVSDEDIPPAARGG